MCEITDCEPNGEMYFGNSTNYLLSATEKIFALQSQVSLDKAWIEANKVQAFKTEPRRGE